MDVLSARDSGTVDHRTLARIRSVVIKHAFSSNFRIFSRVVVTTTGPVRNFSGGANVDTERYPRRLPLPAPSHRRIQRGSTVNPRGASCRPRLAARLTNGDMRAASHLPLHRSHRSTSRGQWWRGRFLFSGSVFSLLSRKLSRESNSCPSAAKRFRGSEKNDSRLRNSRLGRGRLIK